MDYSLLSEVIINEQLVHAMQASRQARRAEPKINNERVPYKQSFSCHRRGHNGNASSVHGLLIRTDDAATSLLVARIVMAAAAEIGCLLEQRSCAERRLGDTFRRLCRMISAASSRLRMSARSRRSSHSTFSAVTLRGYRAASQHDSSHRPRHSEHVSGCVLQDRARSDTTTPRQSQWCKRC